MVLFWPGLLGLLVLVPLLAVVYWWEQRRRKRVALRYSSLSLVRPALRGQPRLRRHLPPALFLLALACLMVAMARPAIVQTVPASQTTVILAMDVSGSMSSADIYPTRLDAAKKAALSFVQSQKSTTQIGIVAFSSNAQLVQQPTTNQARLESSIRSLTIGDSTAIGSGIQQSLQIIDQMNRKNPQAVPQAVPQAREEAKSNAGQIPVTGKPYAPEIIVVLTDGMNNSGPDPEDIAQLAAGQGVRVYTIGYGPEIPNGDSPDKASQTPPSNVPNYGLDNYGNKGGFWPKMLNYDARVLKSVAKMTGGKYYTASDAGQLAKVFASLPIQKIVKVETNEISVAFVAPAGLLAVIALGLSLVWHPIP